MLWNHLDVLFVIKPAFRHCFSAVAISVWVFVAPGMSRVGGTFVEHSHKSSRMEVDRPQG